MARGKRQIVPDGIFHVTSHAVGREPLFADRIDAASYLDRLATATARFECECLLFCLMGTHFHLVLRPESGDLSRLMQWLNGTYAKQYNKRHYRRGHLFESRYDSRLIDTDAYLLEAIRYIVLNPIEANICRRPEDWPYSSYGSLIRERPGLPFVADDELLLVFDRKRRRAIEQIREFVSGGPERRRLDLAA